MTVANPIALSNPAWISSECASVNAPPALHGRRLAANYRLPCRTGGALTAAHSLDIQAGFESAMGLATVIYNGVDFILHAGGALSSFAAFSFEKLVADDEFLGMIRRFRGPLPTSEEAAALEVIASVGPGGSYLMEEHTLD